MKALIKTQRAALPAPSAAAKRFAENTRAANTKRAYKAAWKDFNIYCATRSLRSLPTKPADVAEYIAFCAEGGLSVSTIEVRLAAIALAHKFGKHADPTTDDVVDSVMRGIRRELKTRPTQKSPILLDGLRRMVALLPDSLIGIRDRAIILVGWGGAFRRSELVKLDISDVRFDQRGMSLMIRSSKTDQEGKGANQDIPYLDDKTICPVTALKRWLDESQITSGPLFRKVDRWGRIGQHRLTDQVVALITKRMAESIGLDKRNFAGHSLRSGIVTELAQQGEGALQIQNITRHRSLNTIIEYQRTTGAAMRQTVKKAFGE